MNDSSDMAVSPDTTTPLFARKGRATPVSAKAARPTMYLVDTSPDDTPPAGNDGDPDEGSANGSGEAALFALDDGGSDTGSNSPPAAAPPAASLNTVPFDPSQRRPIAFDDAAVATATEPQTAGAAPNRPRLSTLVLIGAAAAAAIAAVITAASWQLQADRQSPAPSPQPLSAAVTPVPALDSKALDSKAVDSTTAGTTTESVPAVSAAIIEPPVLTIEPVIDLVRVEPGGATIIAGRAAPGTALIVLDNNAPIGNVVAGAAGDWMLTPERTLAGGNHEIALAIKSDGGTVSIATPHTETLATPKPRPTSNRPSTADPGAAGPADKSLATDNSDARYVVQIASVKSAEGATREWAKLKAALPDLLGSHEPTIDTAELRDRGTFYRIRLGPFADRATAHTLCKALDRSGRDCLVVRR